MARRVLVGGGSGFVGKALVRHLQAKKYDVTIISRTAAPGRISWLDVKTNGIGEYDAIVNLSGRLIFDPFKRWTPAFRHECIESRIGPTALLSSAIANAKSPPRVFIATSAIGIYPSSTQTSSLFSESTPIQIVPGNFAQSLCRKIEGVAVLPKTCSTRVVTMRPGVVMGKGGGTFGNLYWPFFFGLGGPMGDGTQPFPWIHLEDLAAMYTFAIESENVSGPFNAVAPDRKTNGEFLKTLAHAMRRPAILPFPALLVKAIFGSDRANMLLEGPQVIPTNATEAGFQWQFPTASAACSQLAS